MELKRIDPEDPAIKRARAAIEKWMGIYLSHGLEPPVHLLVTAAPSLATRALAICYEPHVWGLDPEPIEKWSMIMSILDPPWENWPNGPMTFYPL